MSLGAEIACSVLVFIGFVFTAVSIIDNKWETSDLESLSIFADYKYRGLWFTCQSYSTGTVTCIIYESFFLGLPPKLQAGRAFSLFSVAIGIISLAFCISAISKAPFLKGYASKNRGRLIGGVAAMAAGFAMIIGVSWFAYSVHLDYTRILNSGITSERFVFGEALFIGWVGGSLMLIGGLIAICISCGNVEDEDHPPTAYTFSTKKEYV